MKGEDDMIQMNYSDEAIKFAKDNNVVKEVSNFLNMEECLDIAQKSKEVNKKKSFCVTGDKKINIDLEVINDGDNFIIYIDDIYMR